MHGSPLSEATRIRSETTSASAFAFEGWSKAREREKEPCNLALENKPAFSLKKERENEREERGRKLQGHLGGERTRELLAGVWSSERDFSSPLEMVEQPTISGFCGAFAWIPGNVLAL